MANCSKRETAEYLKPRETDYEYHCYILRVIKLLSCIAYFSYITYLARVFCTRCSLLKFTEDIPAYRALRHVRDSLPDDVPQTVAVSIVMSTLKYCCSSSSAKQITTDKKS